ncbi:hypothetical protein GF377_02880 [candidate division GN15 bacterium]|nr:hypothetical protein [candidate division GN15 bacterium]
MDSGRFTSSDMVSELQQRLEAFSPRSYAQSRCLALYSAAIATADQPLIITAAGIAVGQQVTADQLYEVVLQSYLFLGFPRMLIAAEALDQAVPGMARRPATEPPTGGQVAAWFDRGLSLCQHVYGDTYEKLRSRVEKLAPDVFRWMILEGYGKVLSRPGLDIVDRELCIVTALMMDNRPAQLHSHIKGARNVGAPADLLVQVIDDLGAAAGPGYDEAQHILAQLEES